MCDTQIDLYEKYVELFQDIVQWKVFITIKAVPFT
jgi:hypothetical protein